jgi:para-nitrobenzyl esterase
MRKWIQGFAYQSAFSRLILVLTGLIAFIIATASVMEWPSPAFEGRFGAVHGVDLGLVLGNPRDLIAGNTFEARKMAEIVGSTIVAFGKTGNPNCDKIPNWSPYNTESRATMIFNIECRVENDPTSELRLLWDKI